MNALDRLIATISRLPGIGKKSATRIAYFILTGSPALAHQLAESLLRIHEVIRRCSVCGAFTEIDPCPICENPSRDHGTVCVVEQPQDVVALEASGEFRGLYHVLGGVIAPLDGVGPSDLTMDALLQRVRRSKGSAQPIHEVIIATNPTVEGDTTALYLAGQLESEAVRVTRLALGLPVGGDLEYTDRLTIARSLRGRTAV